MPFGNASGSGSENEDTDREEKLTREPPKEDAVCLPVLKPLSTFNRLHGHHAESDSDDMVAAPLPQVPSVFEDDVSGGIQDKEGYSNT